MKFLFAKSWLRPFMLGVAIGCCLTGVMVGISRLSSSNNSLKTFTVLKATSNTINNKRQDELCGDALKESLG
eukprot:CAMPEP_0203701900 /NCGR_PEP_ID=MMETSP0091-20130426/37482_1 /ASSEMBLY_ACC=CAM_ASM_001089 /TAXON_ID=426623 /ORGANISM="Chaetoceros affinis, Strain CCMP159" /LENGTH=71 /DNA_ID=CAMNT_0050575835 /DNA_START=5 /DNA_END=217 /DNA_ORIENTATION=-